MSDVSNAAPAGTTHLGASPAAAPAASAPAAAAPAAAPAASAPAAQTTPAPSAAPAATPAPSAAPAATPAPSPAPSPAPAEPKKDELATGAPEKYETFTLPEGATLNEPVMGKFQEIAKKHGLSQEAAQEFVSLGVEMQSGNAEALQAAIEQQGVQWGEAAKADKEFGGEKFDENLAVAKKALDQFGTPELRAMLVQSKLGNHPEVLRTFFRIGKAISEDGFVPGRSGNSEGKTPAQRMYPNMNP